MKPATKTYDGWIGRDADGRQGDKIGEIESIYYDDVTGRPEWLAVPLGWPVQLPERAKPIGVARRLGALMAQLSPSARNSR
jgi:hypothetical protein